MAVYKSTHCYPFLNSVDIRVARTNVYDTYPAQYLKCRVDTSNKKITGYRIRLLDGDNNQIFPVSEAENYISPLKELASGYMLDIYDNSGTNSGINGTYLQLPFFQSYNEKRLATYNAIYYKPQFMADHIILTETLAAQGNFSLNLAENLSNWKVDSTLIPGEKCLRYNWPTRAYFYTQDEEPEKVETDYKMYYVAVSDTTNDGVVYVLDDADESSQHIYAYDKGENRIALDDELLSTGQIILVASDSIEDAAVCGFYYVAKVVSDSTIITLLRPLTSWNDTLSTTDHTVITTISKAAKFHNTNWGTVVGTRVTSFVVPGSEGSDLWCDYNGKAISNLDVLGEAYKWEITLYQGDCETSGDPMIADYQKIENDTFDMVLGTGNICGSCSERIQIASGDAFLGNGSINEDAILPGLKSDVLVLQTRYIDLSTIVEGQEIGIFSGNRSYVKSYVESYGYIYPETGGLDSAVVGNATHAQFFKHTNSESAILDEDIVDYGFNEDIEMLFYSTKGATSTSDYSKYDTEEEWEKDTPVTNRLIVVGVDSLPSALTGISSGEKILLTQQGSSGASADFSYRNGVYRYYTLSHNSKTYHCLERAASYTSWSAYVGKVMYIRKGSLGGTNQQALASAGTYTLWNPLSSTSGDSGLGFTTELPILLFQNKLKDNRTYDFFSDSSTYPSDGVLDGEYLQVGNIVLCADGSVKIVTANGNSQTEGGTGSWEDHTENGALIPEANDYTYFAHGIVHSQRVFKFPSTTPCWDLHTAKILKNSANYTYVSPSTQIQAGMKLKLTQGHTIKTSDSNGMLTSWLSIKAFNATLYCIRHEALLSPSAFVAEKTTTDNTPWKYELRTYFRTSDENPFYTNETPYLVLYKNGLEYSDLAMIKTEEATVVSYTAASAVTGRSVKLSAQYKQYNGASWESYRWALHDSQGNKLQDTGKKYDKDMSVVFYGLSNDEVDGSSIYYATLYVEDDLDNTLQYTLKLLVVQGEALTLPVPLTADFDCGIQAVRLEWQDNGILMPGYRVLGTSDDGVDYKYHPSSTYWDGGIQYNGTEAVITGKNGDQTAPIDYAGSTILAEDKDSYFNYLSRAEKYGVNYYAYFNKADSGHEGSPDYALTLTAQDSDTGAAKNELYFETQVRLSENFCGDILSWQVQGKDWSGIQDPYTTVTGASNNKSGYLEFKLKTQDNILADGTINAERNIMLFSVAGYDATGELSPTSHEVTVSLSSFALFPITSSLETKYYLQLQSVVENNSSYLTDNYEYLHLVLPTSLYIKKDSNGICFAGGEYALGNLGLIKSDNTTSKYFTYWVEDRPLLNNPAINNSFLGTTPVQQLLDADRTYGSTDGVLCWPGAAEDSSVIKESDWTWEDGTDISSSPENWNDVDSSEKHVEIVTAMNRHYTIDNVSYHIVCKLIDIDSLYNRLTTDGTVSVVVQTTEDETGNPEALILIGAEGNYGTISIAQNKEE